MSESWTRRRRNETVVAAGLVLASLSLGLVIRSFGSDLRNFPSLQVVLLFLAYLFIGGGCFIAYLLVVKPAGKAMEILSEALPRHGEPIPPGGDLLAIARGTRDRLERYAAELAEAERLRKINADKRLDEMTEAHRDLLTLHRCTKLMLQSQHTEEVFDVFRNGVRDGFGFHGAILGMIDREGELVFRGEADLDGRPQIRIPAYDDKSLLARTLWSGQAVLISSLDGHDVTVDDRSVLLETPAFLLPVTRRQTRKCSDVKHCGNIKCTAYLNIGVRCWIDNHLSCTAQTGASEEEKRKECVLCELFSPIALIAVRSNPDSRRVSRENVSPISMLANEASLALEVVGLHEDLRRMSITDGLTGLINHREFYNLLRRELERGRRYRHTVSLLIIDVDDFKKYNDTFGHLAGDMALKKVAEMLRTFARATDIVARYGGEEFAIILPESTHGGALMLAERIKTEISNHNFIPRGTGEVHLTVSIGIYSATDGVASEDQIVSFADEAAYSAKNTGKNRVVVKTNA